MKKLSLITSICVLVLVGTGCAGARAGLNAARITINKGFDVADKSLETVEKTFGQAVGGTTATISTATTSSPTVAPSAP